ncbi:SDR family oxidoreductase [Hymenobacter sp. BT770]|uniref:SDR family NAD(P)-dependent oxidoreductase n=1 Tax=Hymenobacter sp. BT770 TaxID=2886942 RepID=UPI001D123ACE|nr:SDR family oxidoreductase [Hymenobacter sp. BT770]MCC3153594.1 SDR family oxidoreductase [Hymenobacter sp. BT770]MDO3415830.1 SDR family oxidoreductase [Hymenobacter sp. BT770]
MKRFENKVCLITGGSSGIGRATSLQMAAEGGKVAILSRSQDEGQAVVAEIGQAGGQAVFLQADVGNPEQVKAAVDEVLNKWQRVDVLVNDAAMMTFKPLIELAVEEWDQVMAVNLRAVFLLCKYCIPHMEQGAIVNVSSVHAHETTPNVIPYAASKGAMEAFTRGVSREYDIGNVRINNVAPGAVDTPMLWENPNVKSGQEKVEGAVGRPEDIAEVICFLASSQAAFVNGATVVADGGRLNIL